VTFDPSSFLAGAGDKDDASIDLTLGALAFALPGHPGISADCYIQHVKKLTRDVEARFVELLREGAADDASTRLAALKHILADQEGYTGDSETYDDLQNADLIRVIDRRKGMPIALAILYIQVGRNNGFTMDGLNFPGHFLCRIEQGGVRLIFDAFDRCAVMEAPQLRELVKRIRGKDAELSADYYARATNREILIRLQNNIKLRLIDAGDYKEALKSVEMMRQLDPSEYRLMLDAGVLYAKTGQGLAAIDALEKYLKYATHPQDRYDAEMLLFSLKDQLN